MNMNQLINMFTRMVTKRLMNWGINKGMDTMSGGKTNRSRPNKQGQGLGRKMRTLSRFLRR